MPQPEGSQLNQNLSPMLTNIAISYLPKFGTDGDSIDGITYIAKEVFPNIPVGAPSAQYNVWNNDDFLRIEMKQLANDEAPPIIGFGITKSTYSVQNFGVSAYWTARDLAEAARGGTSPAALVNAKVLQVTGQGVLMLEKLVSALIQTAGNWGSTMAGVTSAPDNVTTFLMWDQAASDPVSDVIRWKRNMKLLTGFVPNKLIIPEVVWIVLQRNANLISRITYGGTQQNPTQVTIDQFKGLVGIQNVLVPNGVYNAGKQGQTKVITEFWGKNVWLGFVASTPSTDQPSAGYHFSWTGATDNGLPPGVAASDGPAQFGSVLSPEGIFIRRYNTDRPARAWVDSELWTTPNVTAAPLGFLATNVVT